ncbi:MAG: hypothetical protein WA705_28340 [Candidatus Ozemobacteraceae bacterium]
MKRVLYGIFTAGLALSLAGCSGGNGGVWPSNPNSPASGGQVQSLAGGKLTKAMQGEICLSQVNTAVGIGMSDLACPMLPFGTPQMTSQRFGSKGKKRTEVATGTVVDPTTNVVANADGFYKFEYSYKTTGSEISHSSTSTSSDGGEWSLRTSTASSSTSVDLSWTYVWYVKYLGSDGKPLSVTSNSEYWYNVVGTPSAVLFYGSWTFNEMSADGKYNAKSVGNFGSSGAPWEFKGIALADSYLQMKGLSDFTMTGAFDGTAVSNFAFIFEVGNDADGAMGYMSIPKTSSAVPTGFYKLTTKDGYVKLVFTGQKQSDGSNFKVETNLE